MSLEFVAAPGATFGQENHVFTIAVPNAAGNTNPQNGNGVRVRSVKAMENDEKQTKVRTMLNARTGAGARSVHLAIGSRAPIRSSDLAIAIKACPQNWRHDGDQQKERSPHNAFWQ